jgi:hypothetical protein
MPVQPAAAALAAEQSAGAGDHGHKTVSESEGGWFCCFGMRDVSLYCCRTFLTVRGMDEVNREQRCREERFRHCFKKSRR